MQHNGSNQSQMISLVIYYVISLFSVIGRRNENVILTNRFLFQCQEENTASS